MAAFNNNPLPTPPQTPDSQAPVAIMLHTLANAIPSMDAEVAHAVATNSQSPDQAVQTGQAAQSFQVTSQQVQALQDQSSANQNAVWKSATATQQAALKSAGYKPPSTGHSFWGSIGHAIGTGLHDTLNVLGAPLRAEQHIERTAFATVNQKATDPLNGSFGDMVHSFTHPGDWVNAWNETSNGEHYILPQVQAQVQKKYGQDTFNLAYKLATGSTMDDLVKAVDPSQQQALAQKIQSDPNVRAAQNELQAGHVSEGTMLARSLGIDPKGKNSKLFNAVSGLSDATMDWFGDPMVVGSKVGAVAKSARYLVRTPTDVHWLSQTNDSVKAANGFIAEHVANGDAAGIREAFPKLSPLVEDMMKSGVDTPQKVEDFFASQKQLENLVKYSPGHLPGTAQGGWMPTLSTAGQLRLAAKGTLQKSIDFLADGNPSIDGLQAGDVVDHPLNGPGVVRRIANTRFGRGTGALLKNLTTLTPPKTFDPTDPKWMDNFANIANIALPRARTNQLLNEMAGAADIGAKRTIYVNTLKEIYARLGVGDTEKGREWLRNFNENNPEHPASFQKYSTSGADMVQMNGTMVPEALDEHGLTTAWHVPDYKTLYAQAKSLGITHAAMGIPNAQYIDKAMQTVWKPLALARVGFAFRVAGEEAFGHLLREGPVNYLKARTALSLLKPGDQIRPKSAILNGWGKAWGMLTDHLPGDTVKAIKTPSDLIAANLGDATQRAMKGVSGSKPLTKYTDAIKLGNKYGIFDEPFAEHISAAHGHGGGYIDGDMLGKHMDVMYQGKMVPATLSPSGAFKGYENTNQLFSSMWYRQLKEIAGSQWDRKALETADQPLPDRIKAVADELEKSPRMASRSVRYHQTADERRVGEDVTQRQALEDWAANLINHVDSVTRKPLGDHIDINGKRLVDHLLDDRKPPTVADLDATDRADRPVSVKGPDVVPVLRGGTGFFTRMVNRAFDVIGRQINWISRQPMYLHHFTESLDAFKPQMDSWVNHAIKQAEDEAASDAKQGTLYHGTRSTTGVQPVRYGSDGDFGLYGPGFYTTDNPDIASSYAESPRGIPGLNVEHDVSPSVYKLKWQGDRKPSLINLDAEHLPNKAAKAIAEAMDRAYRAAVERGDLGGMVPEVAPRLSVEDHLTTLRDSHPDNYRNPDRFPESAGEELQNLLHWSTTRGMSTAGRADLWKDVHASLQKAGYDGFTHTGGQRVGKAMGLPEHNVKIFFDTSKLGTPSKSVTATQIARIKATMEERLVMAAKDRAIEQTIPYVHNPELRSQFAQITRNLAPFWFAQEQFYKRWARTFKYSPWAFRQAQLINQGVAHSGFTHTDPTTGAEYFIYPGANVVQDVLTRSLGVFGYKSWLPINAALRGQVNQASPGLERLGLPSFGPLMVVPLNLVKKAFPELTGPVSSIEGQQAANSSFTQSLVPTTVTRIWQDINSSPNNSAQYASAMMQAIQYLEATGHGIGAVATTEVGSSQDTGTPKMSTKNLKPGDYVTNADGQWVVQGDGQWRRNDPAALATYQARVKNWTRVFLITRTIFGFSGPASPENLFDPSHVNEDLQGLLKTLPFEQAVQTFVKEHPDASAYTVFQTTTKGGGTLPATADAMAFMDANKGFFNAHPLAGAYFLPQVDTSGKFDLKAYQTQLAEGLRLRKTPSEFWQEILYNTAANDYFNAEDRKNLMTAASSGGQKTAIENAWTQQSQEFQQANPLFAAQLGTTPQTPGGLLGGSTTYTRENLMADLYKALQDPRLPENQQTEDIRTLYNSYAAYQGMLTPATATGATSLSSQQKNAIDLEYAQQVSAWVAQHPDVQGLYNRLVRPEISTALNEMAQAQAQ